MDFSRLKSAESGIQTEFATPVQWCSNAKICVEGKYGKLGSSFLNSYISDFCYIFSIIVFHKLISQIISN